MPPEVSVHIVGVLHVAEDIELHCLRESYGWRPFLVVNPAHDHVAEPPPCFQLRPEHVQLLDRAVSGALNLN